MESLHQLHGPVTPLPRGGTLVETSAGAIQFGAPPETIKDTMGLPRSVPRIFVLPRRLFHWQKGINLSDLEFPIYYNYFIRQARTRILCTRHQARQLVGALQEALFGPRTLSVAEDLPLGAGAESVPDLRREMDFFRGNLHFRDVLSLCFFRDGVCTVDGVTVRLTPEGDFEVREGERSIARVPGTVEYRHHYEIGKRLSEPYQPPLFGVTCLGPSHGFDPAENTSGFIIWLNHTGIMIDPPINSTEWLQDSNVNPKLIDSIILTHCHADHDAGTLQKILEEGRVSVYSTRTVMGSFLRKYASLTGESVSFLSQLFRFRPIYIGQPLFIHGGEFRFFYTLHSIPAVGFTLKFQNQSFVYSSDHQADPEVHRRLLAGKVIHTRRYREFRDFPWDSSVIYHESGLAPLHTPITWLDSLPPDVQKRVVVYHIARKDFPRKTHLKLATFGIENTLYFDTQAPAYERDYQILEMLKHLDFFDSLPVEKVQEFVSLVEEKKYRQGQVIIRKGMKGRYFYIIRSGNVRVRDGELIGSRVLGTYEYFGEVALLTEAPRTANVIAETDVVLYALARDRFLSFIHGTEFEKTLQRLINNRSRETWNLMVSSPIFAHLTSYQKTWLESILVPEELPGPGVLIREGWPIEQIYLIRQGEVEVSRRGRTVATLGRGDLVGLILRVQREENADFTFSHRGPVSLFAIRRPDALEFVQRNPGLGPKMVYDFAVPGADGFE